MTKATAMLIFKDIHTDTVDPEVKEAAEKLARYEETGGWNPVEERLPSDNRYILLSFSNFSLPAVGRYEDDAFYLGE